jgi:hypothetical protein
MSIFNDVKNSTPAIPIKNPLKDTYTQFMPKTLEEVFQVCEFAYSNSPQFSSVINRFTSYPITDFIFKTEDESSLKTLEYYMNTILNVKSFCIYTGINKLLYGNLFVSIRQPFERCGICDSCKHEVHFANKTKPIRTKGWVIPSELSEHEPFVLKVKIYCENCKEYTSHIIKDYKSKDINEFIPILWDPRNIEIKHIKVANKSFYYLKIDTTLKKTIEICDVDVLREVPADIIKAAIDPRKPKYKFQDDELLHLKLPNILGIAPEWGMPAFMSGLRSFFYIFSLRSANQSIAQEHLTHHRIIFPQSNDTSGSLLKTIGAANWKQEVYSMLMGKRVDPNYIGISPVPLGSVDLGGTGKMLLVDNEIKNAENNLNLAFGFPVEFLNGSLTNQSTFIGLKILERELINYTTDINRMVTWIARKFLRFYNLAKLTSCELLEFKLLDDINMQSHIMQLQQAGKISENTTNRYVGIKLDPENEKEKITNEAVADTMFQKRLSKKIDDIQNDLNTRIEALQQSMSPEQMNKDQMLAMADQEADILLQVDEGQRRSRLAQINKEDPVYFAVVKMKYDQKKNTKY